MYILFLKWHLALADIIFDDDDDDDENGCKRDVTLEEKKEKAE